MKNCIMKFSIYGEHMFFHQKNLLVPQFKGPDLWNSHPFSGKGAGHKCVLACMPLNTRM